MTFLLLRSTTNKLSGCFSISARKETNSFSSSFLYFAPGFHLLLDMLRVGNTPSFTAGSVVFHFYNHSSILTFKVYYHITSGSTVQWVPSSCHWHKLHAFGSTFSWCVSANSPNNKQMEMTQNTKLFILPLRLCYCSVIASLKDW
jgi:hypothetical protein